MLNEDRVRQLAADTAAAKGGTVMHGPRRERGLWSFLTWSFFLSQLAVGSAFAGGAAQAGRGVDLSAPDGAASPGTAAAHALGAHDFHHSGTGEPHSGTALGAAAHAQADAGLAGTKIGGIEQLDLTSDASLPMQAAVSGSADRASDDVLPVTDSDSSAILSPSTPSIDTVIETPSVQDSLLPPILETIDDLVDGLGPTLDGLLMPVVETVDDLASVLGPTLDQVLSPVETLIDGLVGVLEPSLDPLLAPVASLADGVGELIAPVGGIAGELLALADPVVDIVDPVLSPVTNVAGAAEPILDPVLDIAAPMLDLVEPVTDPLLQPLAPVAEPVLDILPLNIGNGGLLSGILGNADGTDAVASHGMLQFTADAGSAGHDLFEAGTYTEYGLALHETSSDGESGAGDLLGNVAMSIGTLLDDDDDADSGLPTLIGSLQHEIGLRSLGDGLI